MKNGLITEAEKQSYRAEGYLIVKSVLNEQEIAEIKDRFMKLHAGGAIPGCFQPLPPEESEGDILKQYPRMMHPHRVDSLALSYMIHPKVMGILADLMDEEPLACQSMFYFKPPGARGQALHQDNFFLKVEPGTCVAAWMAIDPADEENGGMHVVPKSNSLDILCPHEADPKVSFAKNEVDVPEGFEPEPVNLKAGDILFFNGSVIHGSYPNTSQTRFRRAYIGHYVGASTHRLGKSYHPLYNMKGESIEREVNANDLPCGEEY